MTYTKEQRRARFEALPEALKDVFVSEETADAVGRIAEKYNLGDERTTKLASEIGTVLLGLIHKEKFAEQLVTELFLSPEQAQKVAGDIDREIFKNIPRPSGTPFQGGMQTIPPLREVSRAERGTEDVSPQNTPPRPAFGGTPLLNQGGDERKVPIRKEIPPRQSSGQAPQLPTIQSLLADIKRGTAYDDRRINEAYRKTPVEVRQTLESVGFLSRLENIAKKFGLNVEETGELVSESGLVMLGLTLPVHFVDNLGKRLRLPRDRAMAVGQAVNMEVLRPVREILRKMGDTNQRTNTNIRTDTKIDTNENKEEKTETGYRFAPPTPHIPTQTPIQAPPANLPVGVPNYSPSKQLPSTFEEQKAKIPVVPEIKKYATDPYREPLS